LIIDDDANNQSVMNFHVNLLTFKVERLNFINDVDDVVEYV